MSATSLVGAKGSVGIGVVGLLTFRYLDLGALAGARMVRRQTNMPSEGRDSSIAVDWILHYLYLRCFQGRL